MQGKCKWEFDLSQWNCYAPVDIFSLHVAKIYEILGLVHIYYTMLYVGESFPGHSTSP